MDNVMTLKEVAAYLQLHPATIYRLLKTRQIPAFRIASEWRFNREQIDAWMAELRKPKQDKSKLGSR
jgi:excisionase family DNA binding protein